MQITATLKCWEIYSFGNDMMIIGDVYGDIRKRWPDGTSIHTSKVLVMKEDGNQYVAVTLNSSYVLPKDESIQALVENLQEKLDARRTSHFKPQNRG